MATAGAKLRGHGLIIGVDSVANRQELGRAYGADEIRPMADGAAAADPRDRPGSRMTAHSFGFNEMPRALEVSDKKLDNTMKVLVSC